MYYLINFIIVYINIIIIVQNSKEIIVFNETTLGTVDLNTSDNSKKFKNLKNITVNYNNLQNKQVFIAKNNDLLITEQKQNINIKQNDIYYNDSSNNLYKGTKKNIYTYSLISDRIYHNNTDNTKALNKNDLVNIISSDSIILNNDNHSFKLNQAYILSLNIESYNIVKFNKITPKQNSSLSTQELKQPLLFQIKNIKLSMIVIVKLIQYLI